MSSAKRSNNGGANSNKVAPVANNQMLTLLTEERHETDLDSSRRLMPPALHSKFQSVNAEDPKQSDLLLKGASQNGEYEDVDGLPKVEQWWENAALDGQDLRNQMKAALKSPREDP